MSMNGTTSITTDSNSYTVKFVILIILQIPSSIASSIIMIYILLTPQFRSKEHNRSICFLLCFNFLQIMVDLPMTINFFRSGGIVQPANSSFCIWWIWYEFALNGITIDIMAWISIERHILVFYSNYTHAMSHWKRWSIHTLPLVVCSLWGPIFAMITVIISPMCTNTWIFNNLLYGLPCYLFTNWGTFDLAFNIIVPVFIILLANMALAARIIGRKLLGINRNRVNWQQQRKMVIQLAIFATLYLSIWFPLCVVQLGLISSDPTMFYNLSDIVNYLVYVVPLLLPFACLLSRTEILKKAKKLFQEKTHVQVMPLTTH